MTTSLEAIIATSTPRRPARLGAVVLAHFLSELFGVEPPALGEHGKSVLALDGG